MYTPRPFLIDDFAEIKEFVVKHPSITLVTVGKGAIPFATLLPSVWETENLSTENFGQIITHMSKGNQQWREIASGDIGLAIVQGPQAYVSPTNYENKETDHKVVPTWNYQTVHFTGTLEVIDDPARINEIVSHLTDFHEKNRAQPWATSQTDPAYMANQLNAIVGIVLTVTKVEAKYKLSQNRSSHDQESVMWDLAKSSISEEREISREMRRNLKNP
jgi:transcriptional regulator